MKDRGARRGCSLSQEDIGWITGDQMDKGKYRNGNSKESRKNLKESFAKI